MKSPLTQKLLALDTGSKRIGLALWIPETEWIRPLAMRQRKTLKEDLVFLEKLIADEKIEGFVVGIPLSLGGKETDSTRTAYFWVETLKEKFKLPVHLQDEAFSTSEAMDRLRHRPAQKRLSLRDSASASIILEEFVRDFKSRKVTELTPKE